MFPNVNASLHMRYTLVFSLILFYTQSYTQKVVINDLQQIGLIKTISDKILGYGFVAMNENVVFTAAHNISFEEQMIFQSSDGNVFPLNIVATDPTGDIGVLLASDPISTKTLWP